MKIFYYFILTTILNMCRNDACRYYNQDDCNSGDGCGWKLNLVLDVLVGASLTVKICVVG